MLTKPGLRPKRQISKAHSAACRKYKEWFLTTYGYGFCEMCDEKNPLRFDTHHIVCASSAPQHKNLHDFRNLILLCRNCHDKVEQNPDENLKLIIKRRLWLLFTTPATRRAKEESEKKEKVCSKLLSMGSESSD